MIVDEKKTIKNDIQVELSNKKGILTLFEIRIPCNLNLKKIL